MKQIIFFMPLSIYLICAFIKVLLIINFINYGYGIFSIVLFFLCLVSLTFHRSVRLYDNKCSFNNHLLFFKYRKRVIEIGVVEEIFLCCEQKYSHLKNISVRNSSGFKTVINNNCELYIINKRNVKISVVASSNSNKLLKIGQFFSKKLNVPLQKINKKTRYPGTIFNENNNLGQSK